MGKKKSFIDKKNSATFQLLVRDSSSYPPASSASDPPPSDRVFVRVDNNPYSSHGFHEEDDTGDRVGDGPESSIFADAPGDTEDDELGDAHPPAWIGAVGGYGSGAGGTLPEHIRKEILELGLPDDGYNYLTHLREIRIAGGGSAYYANSKARIDLVPLDVKAYDASRLRIKLEDREESNEDAMFKVASKAVGVKVHRAVDPDVLRLLEDDNLSRFGSDVEDLEEDFVTKANLPEEGKEAEEKEEGDKKVVLMAHDEKVDANRRVGLAREENEDVEEDIEDELAGGDKPRVRRLLDEQFDLLTLREYDDDSDVDDVDYVDKEPESLAGKLKIALKDYPVDDLELEDKYRTPGGLVRNDPGSTPSTQLDISADVIRRCVEYAERYCNDSQEDEEVVLIQESSDESEDWDCETIVSTYSNLDNHPGRIQAPENPKKRLSKIPFGDSVSKSNVIVLRGKEKLPVEYLPGKKSSEKVKTEVSLGADKEKRKPHKEESKEEKKERKAAIKQEKRQARQAKKELKGLYRCEAQRAQKAAAVSGPSSIHLF